MKTRLTKCRVDTAAAHGLLSELIPFPGSVLPSFVRGWRDRRGRLRRLCGDYPNGWRVRLTFDAGGNVTSCSAALRFGNGSSCRD